MTAVPATLPENDAARVAALRDLQILDTLPEQAYEDLVSLAASICNTPIALVSLVDSDRQWFKAKLGLTASETHRDLAFCSHAILEPDSVFVVGDAHADSRFATNELVTDGPHVRAYAGAPIVMESGDVLGTLCVIDSAPRSLSAEQISALQVLARQAAGQLELRRVNLHLESMVEDRTRDLQTALQAAEIAARAKSEFVSAMSHEIRTPMNGVVGMIDVLEQTRLGTSQKEIVSMARESAHSLLRIVDDILDFSKIEAGNFHVDKDSMSLERVTVQACETLALLADSKGVKLNAHIDDRLPKEVLGDGPRVGQVLLNLIGNAIKFSSGEGRAGIVDVHVRLTERDNTRCETEIAVVDNGIGMDDAVKARLFTPFTQADAGTTKRFGGTGLGLSISARLASLMGGSIAVESSPGGGSCFTVRLPFEYEESSLVRSIALNRPRYAGDAEITTETIPAPLPAAIDGSDGRRILVAEDNEMNQQVISRQLGILGFSADLAASGQVALDKLRHGAYALLLTDLHMPVMDGFELAAKVRAGELTGSRLPIVALTADVALGVAARCREVGMDECVHKPLPLASLRALLEHWLPKNLQPLPLVKLAR